MKTTNTTPHESAEQMTVAGYLDARPTVLWCHVPNGAGILGAHKDGRKFALLAKLKRMGVKKGVPDVVVFTPPPKFPQAKGAVIEMKRRKGGTVEPEQLDWLARLTALGWKTAICKGSDEAIRQLQEWGY